MAKSYYNIIEVLVNICAVSDNKIKILLRRKKNEPYRGYWMLPGDVLSNDQTLEECAENIVVNSINFPNMFLMQSHVFSNLDRDSEERIIACSFTSLTVKEFVHTSDMQWFDISELPKLAYDHESIIKVNIDELKKKVVRNDDNILFKLFPHDFTLSELQSFFENILDKSLDRRNFRKKLLTDNIVVETGEKINTAGRPSKLYVFNKGGSVNE